MSVPTGKAIVARYFFYIGGNDSMDAAEKLAQLAAETNCGMVALGVPETIDNEIGPDGLPVFARPRKQPVPGKTGTEHAVWGLGDESNGIRRGMKPMGSRQDTR